MRHLALALLLLSACTDDTSSGGDDKPVTGADDSGGGLSDPGLQPDDITAEISEYVHTVVIVRWHTDTETAGYVEFGEDDAYGLRTPLSDVGTEHEVLLLGNTADTEVHFRVVTDANGEQTASDDHTITTLSLPPGLYPMRTTGTSQWQGYQVIPLQGSSYAVTIINSQGEYVWYYEMENVGNLMRAFLTHDAQHIVYCLAGPQDALQDGKMVWVSMDGSEVTELALPNVDHDVVELPDGTIGAIVVTGDAEGNVGDSIVELSTDGTLTTVFRAFDTWTADELYVENEHNLTHANAIDYDPEEDAYYFSMKTQSSLAKINRATGEVEWTMNGRLNQFTFADGTPLDLHHQFEVLDGSILFFENGPVDRTYSRAVEVEYDETNLTAEEVWEYRHDPDLHIFAKGDVHRFGDGVTQVTWSTSGEIQQVDEAGSVLWQLNLELGQAFTFVQPVVSLYGE